MIDFEITSVDLKTKGSPSYAIPRLFERHSLRYDNIALWEIHEAFCRGSAREKVALSVHLYSVMHNRSDKAPRD